MSDEDPGTGRGQPEGIRDVFQGGSTGGVDFRVRYLGADPPHWTGPRKFSTQGRAVDHGKTAVETEGGGLGLSNAGVSNGGGGLQGYQGLHPKEA